MQNKNSSQSEDIELVNRAQSGDDQAFKCVLEKYSPLISSIVRKYFLVSSDIEDLMQIGFLSLVKAIKSYNKDAGASFSSYLYMSVQGDIKNEIAKSTNNKNLALNQSISFDLDEDDERGGGWAYVLVADESSIEDKVIKKQKVHALIGELKQNLNKSERQIMSLYLQGYKYSEISLSVGVTTKKVDNTITKAKRILERYAKQNDLY